MNEQNEAVDLREVFNKITGTNLHMTNHAKRIWHAWVDGKEVQTKQGYQEEWITCSPVQVMPEMMPHRVPDLWRIKPEKETHWFRVYRYIGEEFELTNTAREGPDSHWEAQPFFGGWLTDWTPYEVEV